MIRILLGTSLTTGGRRHLVVMSVVKTGKIGR
jgi:hypothetical protein